MQNLTGIFAKFFMYFLNLLYPKRAWKSPALSELNWYFDGNFTQLALLIETFDEKSQTHKRKTLYHYNIFIALTANRVNKNNKSNDRD